jgi:hypothetical protein
MNFDSLIANTGTRTYKLVSIKLNVFDRAIISNSSMS